MAGRNKEKLEKIRDEISREYPAAQNTAILTGDAEDKDSLIAIASQTTVLISTSGPFAKLGTHVVEACIAAGTHYCDVTGESGTALGCQIHLLLSDASDTTT